MACQWPSDLLFCIVRAIMVLGMTLTVASSRARAGVWEFMPKERLFESLTADPWEVQTGMVKAGSYFRGIIGKSTEVVGVLIDRGDSEPLKLNGGIDGGVSSRLGKEGVRFPLDTVDYLVSFRVDGAVGMSSLRFRLSHISAHFGDGHRNVEDERRTFSKEFIDIAFSYRFENLRLYSRVGYDYHNIPSLPKGWFQLGGKAEGSTLGENIFTYFAYDLQGRKRGGNFLIHQIQLGLKFGFKDSGGIMLALVYHRGMRQEGQYYDQVENYLGAGFFFDP